MSNVSGIEAQQSKFDGNGYAACVQKRNKNKRCPPRQFSLAPPLPPAAPPLQTAPVKLFPFTPCTNRRVSSSPYTVSYVGSTDLAKPAGHVRVCVQIAKDRVCTPASGPGAKNCCSMNIAKVELAVNAECRAANAVRAVTYNGNSKSWSYEKKTTPDGTLDVLKVTNLRTQFFSFGTEPIQLCFELQPPCLSLEELCLEGVCRHALFDYNQQAPVINGGCCPTSNLF